MDIEHFAELLVASYCAACMLHSLYTVYVRAHASSVNTPFRQERAQEHAVLRNGKRTFDYASLSPLPLLDIESDDPRRSDAMAAATLLTASSRGG